MSCNDCILIYWDNHPYFWKGCGFFSHTWRSVRRRNIKKSVLIDFSGDFHSVVEAHHCLLCLMYTVLNNAFKWNLCESHVMTWLAFKVKGFLNSTDVSKIIDSVLSFFESLFLVSEIVV